MNVKGVIIEDDQGRELVVVCNRSHSGLAKVFALRGWQRRRLVPLRYTEREIREVARGVLDTLNDLFKRLPTLRRDVDGASSDQESPATPLLKSRKPSLLREVSRRGRCKK